MFGDGNGFLGLPGRVFVSGADGSPALGALRCLGGTGRGG
jgi:hypothetical protein